MQKNKNTKDEGSLDLMLAVRVDAQHGALCLKCHKAEAAVLRAVDLVSRQVHIHDIAKLGKILLYTTTATICQPRDGTWNPDDSTRSCTFMRSKRKARKLEGRTFGTVKVQSMQQQHAYLDIILCGLLVELSNEDPGP